MLVEPSPHRVLAKYKEKKEVPKADGSGTTTVYVYGPRQVAERNRAKAERVEKLRKSIDQLRKKYKNDLKSETASIRLTALAVALIDHTYERVGNDASAENGHFGVTGWQVDHITLSKGKAILEYVGKSGVKHRKVIEDKTLVDALEDVTFGKKGSDKILCEGDDCAISSSEVNSYLSEFDITAKDLRGMHANEVTKAALKEVRSKGEALPRDRKERDKILKAELKEALEIAAEAVGHESSTLKNQYLVPGLVESFLHDGTILEKLYEKKSFGPTTIDYSDPELLAWVRGFFGRYPSLKEHLAAKVGRVENPHHSHHPQASYSRGIIEIYPKFWALSSTVRDVVFAHEIGHHVLSRWGDRNMLRVAEQLGIDPWDSGSLPYGEFNYDEAFATCFAEYHVDHSELSRRYPLWGSLVARVGKKEASVMPGFMRTSAYDICAHCPLCQGILSGGKFYDGCSDCGYEVNLVGFGGWASDPCAGKPCERADKTAEWAPIPEGDPRLAIMAERQAKSMAFFTRKAAGNQKIIEAPHNFHPVELEEPKAKRKEFPFEGFIDFQGIEIDVENIKGGTRSGTDPNGNKWSIDMNAHYGEIRGTEGTDGDKLDVYVGDNHDSSVVVVIYQHDPDTGAYDEDKVMLGFDSVEEAIGVYKKQYDRPGFFKKDQFITMPIGQFWRWVNNDKNRGKKVREASSSRVGIINLWNATDGEDEFRGISGLLASLTNYELAIVQDILVHGVPIISEGLQYTLRGHVVDAGAVNELLAARYLEETVDGIRISGLLEAKIQLYTASVKRVASRWATKSRAEREDEKTEALIKPSPTKKPPREDLRRRVVDPDKDKDPDTKADKRDLSNNYKDASPKWTRGKKFIHEDTGNKVNFSSLPLAQQDRLREQHYSKTRGENGAGSKPADSGKDPSEDEAPAGISEQIDPSSEKAEETEVDSNIGLAEDMDAPWPPIPSPEDDQAADLEETIPKGSPMPKIPEDLSSEVGLRAYKGKVIKTYLDRGLSESEIRGIMDNVQGGMDVPSAARHLDELVSAKSEETKAKQRERVINKALKHLGDDADDLQEKLDRLSPEGFEFFSQSFKDSLRKLSSEESNFHILRKKVEEARDRLKSASDPEELGNAAAVVRHWESVVNNPLADRDSPIPKAGHLLGDSGLSRATRKSAARTTRAVSKYRDMDSDTRREHYLRLQEESAGLPDNDARAVELKAIQRGIGFASALEDDEDATGVASSMARLVKAADRTGNLDKLAGVSAFGSPEEDDQAVVRSVYEDMTGNDWLDLVEEDHPARPLAELLADPSQNKYMSEEDLWRVREHLTDLMLADTSFLDPEISKVLGEDATVGAHNKAARIARQQATPKRSPPRASSPVSDMLSWLREFTKNLVTRNPWAAWYQRTF